jgi:Mn2+/Fe2+ NRAMP family transporter
VVEKGTTMRDYKYEKIGVYSGSAFSILVAYFIIVATAATLFKASNGAGFPLESAKQAAVSLEPLLGRAAEYTFAAGLLGASLLAAGVLPLATSYSITEALGFENGVNRKFGEAPVFWSLFTGLIVISVLVAAIPGLPVVQILINIYVLNGIILPFILFAVLLLVNNKELMGRYTNGLVYNIIAWSIAVVVSLLSLFLVVNSLLGLFGLNLLGS